VASDIKIFHFSQGEGKNVLVLHGGPGYPFLEPIPALENLAEEYQFHYYDQRGCGKSTRPINTFSSQNYYQNAQTLEKRLGLSAQIADIERIRQILGDDKIILMGHSYGAFLAALYAAEFPEHVAGLILIAPANLLVMPQEEDDLFSDVRGQLPEKDLEEYDQFMEDYFDFKNLFQKSDTDLVNLQLQFGKYYILSLDEPFSTPQGNPGGWMVWAMYMSTGYKYDYRPILQQIQVPALVIHAAGDLQSENSSRMYSDTLPNADFVSIQDAQHMVYEDQPEQFADEVRAFLESLD
jgi:proline iminopeptidase